MSDDTNTNQNETPIDADDLVDGLGDASGNTGDKAKKEPWDEEEAQGSGDKKGEDKKDAGTDAGDKKEDSKFRPIENWGDWIKKNNNVAYDIKLGMKIIAPSETTEDGGCVVTLRLKDGSAVTVPLDKTGYYRGTDTEVKKGWVSYILPINREKKRRAEEALKAKGGGKDSNNDSASKDHGITIEGDGNVTVIEGGIGSGSNVTIHGKPTPAQQLNEVLNGIKGMGLPAKDTSKLVSEAIATFAKKN